MVNLLSKKFPKNRFKGTNVLVIGARLGGEVCIFWCNFISFFLKKIIN
jgi:hypothetical protein